MLNVVDVLTHLEKDEINNARVEVLQALKGCKSIKDFRNIAYLKKTELTELSEKYQLGPLKIEIIGEIGHVYVGGAPLTAFGLESDIVT